MHPFSEPCGGRDSKAPLFLAFLLDLADPAL
jgi:hypothetical protein